MLKDNESAFGDGSVRPKPLPNSKTESNGIFWEVLALTSLLKLTLLYTYRSTDFEVHRNWLAITYSLPVNKWYYENTSEWTLDYPPFFAWFEYILANIAVLFDAEMVKLQNLNYSSNATIIFQRLSVILSDVVLAYGLKRCCSYLKSHRSRKCSNWKYKWRSPTAVLQILVLGNCGLLIVDHIHFQYNGLLLGILLISICNGLEGNYLSSAFWYTVLLNMKHIYLYVAPVYFIYFVRNYCFRAPNKRIHWKYFSVKRFCKLAGIVFGITALSFGPFILMGQLSQVVSRLFPFKRGLTHAYWAPNFWAFYNFLDKVLSTLLKVVGVHVNTSQGAMTGGLVQEYQHSILPSISPFFTFICTLVSILPCLWKLWKSPTVPLHFVRCIALSSGCAFIFGWHVHEKAILMTIVPLSLTSVMYNKEAKLFVILSTIGHYSLLPLLFTPAEFYVKYSLYILYILYLFISCRDLLGRDRIEYSLPFLSKWESLYIGGLGILFLYECVLQKILGFDIKYPFLGLMLVSVYCSLGVMYSVAHYYYYFLFYDSYKFKSY